MLNEFTSAIPVAVQLNAMQRNAMDVTESCQWPIYGAF